MGSDDDNRSAAARLDNEPAEALPSKLDSVLQLHVKSRRARSKLVAYTGSNERAATTHASSTTYVWLLLSVACRRRCVVHAPALL